MTLPMTDEEICRDYRAAKSPMKQIGILAQLNGCPKDIIKDILVDGGCELPGNMRPKPKGPRKLAEADVEQAGAVAKRKSVTLVAFDLICELADCEGYDRALPGIVALVKALREEGYE